ncbi:helix-turn-helix domain-containing protein [Phytomonospora sp. NPDC050363]|uniref:helix-turn-helix domain-containing protein n=1 Tax=Phytomonospora sp. NPDC050363 TaxID=3155642 RepID=UPI0033E5A3B4
MATGDPSLSASELARRWDVHRSSVTRFLQRLASDGILPDPVNPGAASLRWLPTDLDPLWQQRQPVGRPPKPRPKRDDGPDPLTKH